jgi:hypothetical protein
MPAGARQDRRLTDEDFCRIPDDGKRHEIIDGREYWVVDGERGTIQIHRRASDGSFPLVARLSADDGGVLTTPLLPGFSLAMDELVE